jgi:hypothetical protein
MKTLIMLSFPLAGMILLLIQQAIHSYTEARREYSNKINRDFGRVENVFPKYRRETSLTARRL